MLDGTLRHQSATPSVFYCAGFSVRSSHVISTLVLPVLSNPAVVGSWILTYKLKSMLMFDDLLRTLCVWCAKVKKFTFLHCSRVNRECGKCCLAWISETMRNGNWAVHGCVLEQTWQYYYYHIFQIIKCTGFMNMSCTPEVWVVKYSQKFTDNTHRWKPHVTSVSVREQCFTSRGIFHVTWLILPYLEHNAYFHKIVYSYWANRWWSRCSWVGSFWGIPSTL
jgi:hypothetical protein